MAGSKAGKKDLSHLTKAQRQRAEKIQAAKEKAAAEEAAKEKEPKGKTAMKTSEPAPQSTGSASKANGGMLTEGEIKSLPVSELQDLAFQYQSSLHTLGQAYRNKVQCLTEAEAATNHANEASKKALERQKADQKASSVTTYSLINQALRINAFHSGLSEKVVQRAMRIARDPRVPSNEGQRQRLDALEAWVRTVTSSATAIFESDTIACALQSNTDIGSLPFLRTDFVPKDLLSMQPEGDFLPDQSKLLATCEQAWTYAADEKDFQYYEAAEASRSVGSAVASATMTEAQLVSAGFLEINERREIAGASSSDGSDVASRKSSPPLGSIHSSRKGTPQPSPESEPNSSPFASREKTAAILAAWKGLPLGFKPREKKGGRLLVGKEKDQAVKPAAAWDGRYPIPACASSDPPYDGMPTAWMCLSAHCRGQYCHAGDKLCCNGCGTSRARHKDSRTRNLPFYMVSGTTVVIPDTDTQVSWHANTDLDPVRITTENQKASQEYKLLEKVVAGSYTNLSKEARRVKTLEAVRKKLWPKDQAFLASNPPSATVPPADGAKVPTPGQSSGSTPPQPVDRPDKGTYLPYKLHYPEADKHTITPNPKLKPSTAALSCQIQHLVSALGLTSAADISNEEYPVSPAIQYMQIVDPNFDSERWPFQKKHWRYAKMVRGLVNMSKYDLWGVLEALQPYCSVLGKETSPTRIPGSFPPDIPEKEPGFNTAEEELKERHRRAFWFQRAVIRNSPDLLQDQRRGLLSLVHRAILHCHMFDTRAPVESEPLPMVWFEIAYLAAVDDMGMGHQVITIDNLQKLYYDRIKQWPLQKRKAVLLTGTFEMARVAGFWPPGDTSLGPDAPLKYHKICENAPGHPQIHGLKAQTTKQLVTEPVSRLESSTKPQEAQSTKPAIPQVPAASSSHVQPSNTKRAASDALPASSAKKPKVSVHIPGLGDIDIE